VGAAAIARKPSSYLARAAEKCIYNKDAGLILFPKSHQIMKILCNGKILNVIEIH